MPNRVRQPFSNDYAKLVRAAAGVSERRPRVYGGVTTKISEEVVRCLWFGRHFDATGLYTEDGSRLEIISPGRWNVEGGPDHLNAEILLEGAGRIKGDVEVHVNASDWKRHGHHRQDGYKEVCLHVVMWNDVSQDYVCDVTGRNVPQLALSKYIAMPPEDIPGFLDDLAEYPASARYVEGPCRTALAKSGGTREKVERVLDHAGDQRILSKAGRFGVRLDSRPYEHVLYEALMRALGYKNNVLQFSQLAALVPLEDMRRFIPVDVTASHEGHGDRHVWIQSMLLGAGGILSHWEKRGEDGRNNLDRQTQAYLREISRLWREIGPQLGKKPMRYDDWHWAGVRPLNQPPRRIAAMSHLLAGSPEGGVFRTILTVIEEARTKIKKAGLSPVAAKGATRRIESFFSDAGVADAFWSRYVTPGGKRLKSPARLIGSERAAVIFVNVILPLLLVYARRNRDAELEALLHKAYKIHRKNSTDGIVGFMSKRVLPEEFSGVVNNARRQQGLHQIFHDFCGRKDISCDRCGFLMAIGGSQVLESTHNLKPSEK